MAFASSFLCAACDRRWEEHETFFESEETRRRGGRPYGMGVAGGLRPLPGPLPAFFPPFALFSAIQWQLQGFPQLGEGGKGCLFLWPWQGPAHILAAIPAKRGSFLSP